MARLKEICELIVDCEHKTAPTQGTGYPSIRTPNIGRGRLILDGVNRVSEETYRAWTQREVPQPGDLILAREAPIGNVASIPPGLKVCLGQRTVLIRADIRAVNPQYLTYLLLGDEIQGRILSISNGATVHHLNMKDIRELEMPPIPDPLIQDRIADILSAYDDLIENNTRRIKILEKMAQMLYREWFVNSRFPGHEKVRMVQSELGPIPEGWSAGTVSQMAILHRDGINPADFPDELFLHFSIPSFDNDRTPVREKGTEIKSNKYRVVTGCVLLSKLNPRIPRLWMPSLGCGLREITSTEFLVLTPPVAVHRTYLFQFLSSAEFSSSLTGRSLGTSTSHQRVKPDDFLNLPSLLPARPVVDKFCRIVDPMMDEISVLRSKNANLRATRDLLLPKLISGEIQVEAARPGGADPSTLVERNG